MIIDCRIATTLRRISGEVFIGCSLVHIPVLNRTKFKPFLVFSLETKKINTDKMVSLFSYLVLFVCLFCCLVFVILFRLVSIDPVSIFDPLTSICHILSLLVSN